MDPQSSSMAPSAEAVTVGGYQVLGRLAVGGMSELFLAQESVGGEALRYVVIKLLPAAAHSGGLSQPDAEELFLREGRTLLRLDHPNICYSYAFGTTGSRRYIAMEWIDGVSLRELLIGLREQGRGIAFHLSANLIAQVAAGLEHAHTARDARRTPLGVVHRDVNPTNVMIRHDGVVKLIDFGVAQVAERRSEVDIPLVRGKLAYMAPEQVRGDTLDHRADIFALGVCLYELLTGTRLYRRGSAKATAGAVLDEDVPSPRAVDPNVPEELDEVVRRALQKDPAARFASAGELQAALEDYLVKVAQPMGARPMAALMVSVFPGRGGQPHVEALVDVAERFSDPGPLPSATAPRNDTVRPAAYGEKPDERPSMRPIVAHASEGALDASGMVPTDLVEASARADETTTEEDVASEDERPTLMFESKHPAALVEAAGLAPDSVPAPDSVTVDASLSPALPARPRARTPLYLGLTASLILVAVLVVWSSGRGARGAADERQAGSSRKLAPPSTAPDPDADSTANLTGPTPQRTTPVLTSSSIAGDDSAAAGSSPLEGRAVVPAEVLDVPSPERKPRARKPRSSPGFIADPGF